MSIKDKKLMILESPSKNAKIKSFLDDSWIIMASKGHIRDLDGKTLSVDTANNFEPTYILSDSKKYVVQELKNKMKQCSSVWLASDCDREGESIAWHVSQVLKPNIQKRIAFTEITKKAILNAIDNPRDINMDMFYAQQARRILDRLIGYLISPILWKQLQNSTKKKISLSAGRVQSVVLRLVTERETEIQKFESGSYFKINGIFTCDNQELSAELDDTIENKKTALGFIKYCKMCKYTVLDVKSSKTTRKPSAPFTTSTLQQEASNKFRMSPKDTMRIAQQLYENGYITYMRTDSVELSDDAIDMIQQIVVEDYGDKYFKQTKYKNKSKNSQEAHEACRPCKFSIRNLENDESMDNRHQKLYKLIWKRTVASQMSPAKMEILNTKIDVGDSDYKFISKQERVLFDGFQILYSNTNDDSDSDENELVKKILKLKVGDVVHYQEITSTEKYSKPTQSRYTEASLVKKLDDIGIGRPSTYSSMVSLIQDRNYVEKKDLVGKEVECSIFKLHNNTIETNSKKTIIGGDKQKLVPCNIGFIVVDFLMNNFVKIMDYKFTALVEDQLDSVANGKIDWVKVVRDVYNIFYPSIEVINKSNKLEKDNYSRVLGLDPETKMEVLAYIAKYGPVVKLSNTNGKDKYAPLKNIKIEDVNLEQALELLKYPLDLGSYQNKKITISIGKFGKYIKYNDKNYSIDTDHAKNSPNLIEHITAASSALFTVHL